MQVSTGVVEAKTIRVSKWKDLVICFQFVCIFPWKNKNSFFTTFPSLSFLFLIYRNSLIHRIFSDIFVHITSAREVTLVPNAERHSRPHRDSSSTRTFTRRLSHSSVRFAWKPIPSSRICVDTSVCMLIVACKSNAISADKPSVQLHRCRSTSASVTQPDQSPQLAVNSQTVINRSHRQQPCRHHPIPTWCCAITPHSFRQDSHRFQASKEYFRHRQGNRHSQCSFQQSTASTYHRWPMSWTAKHRQSRPTMDTVDLRRHITPPTRPTNHRLVVRRPRLAFTISSASTIRRSTITAASWTISIISDIASSQASQMTMTTQQHRHRRHVVNIISIITIRFLRIASKRNSEASAMGPAQPSPKMEWIDRTESVLFQWTCRMKSRVTIRVMLTSR